MNISKEWPLIIGILAMIFLVAGTLAESGSILQKILFLIGAPTLGITAYANKQKMFTILQLIATVGAIIAFFPGLPTSIKYSVMIIGTIVALVYLIKEKYFDQDKWGYLGGIGLISIAFGLATNPVNAPFWFGLLLGAGGLIVSLYSAISFFHHKIKIAFIWFVLNIIFSIAPILIFLRALK